jgi:hypothetical protein
MKYMLVMNSPRDGYTQYMNWPKKILEANMAFMHEFTNTLAESGELIGTWGLAAPEQAKLVRAGKNGTPITDGVFPESKEYLAGFFLVDVPNEARALQLAAQLSSAPGAPVTSASGKPIDHFWIELRAVMGSADDMK